MKKILLTLLTLLPLPAYAENYLEQLAHTQERILDEIETQNNLLRQREAREEKEYREREIEEAYRKIEREDRESRERTKELQRESEERRRKMFGE